MPGDFIVRLEQTGGMVPAYLLIYISRDSSMTERRKGAYQDKTVFRCSEDELQALYGMGKKYHFYSMSSENHGQVYDRGGTVIEMGSAKNPYRVSDSGSDFLKEPYKKNFRALTEEILSFVENKTSTSH